MKKRTAQVYASMIDTHMAAEFPPTHPRLNDKAMGKAFVKEKGHILGRDPHLKGTLPTHPPTHPPPTHPPNPNKQQLIQTACSSFLLSPLVATHP